MALVALVAALIVVVFGLVVPPALPVWHKDSANLPTLADGGGMRSPPASRPGFSTLGRNYASSSADAARRFAFFAVLDPGAHVSLRRHAPLLDGLLPDFLTLGGAHGELGRKEGSIEERVRRWLRREAPGLEIYPVLSSGDRPGPAAALLASPVARSRLALALSRYLETNADAGVALALSDLPPSSHAHVYSFAAELRRSLGPAGRKVILVTSAAAEPSRVRELAQEADYVLMTFYREFEPGAPGPLADQAWFENQLALRRASLDQSKFIVGLGSFGYDSGSLGAPVISIQSIWARMKNAGAPLTFDGRALNPWFRYVEPGGAVHDVWFLDGAAMFNLTRAALMRRPAGLALWRLGAEDPGVWASFGKGREPNAAALARMAHLPNDIHVDPAAFRAEVVTRDDAGEAGTRSLAYNESLGLIVGEEIRLAASAKGLTAWRADDMRQIALTFDDGPDEAVTGRILDILAEKSVKASFFIVGRHALASPGVTRRLYREGHDLGNHTFSHPRLSTLSRAEFELELNATSRALEVVTGVHTMLFRPTYAAGVSEPENLSIIETASGLGYVTAMAGVDSYDWMFPQPSAQRMRDAVLRQVLEGRGQIVVFHDWGKKQATLEALPLVIDGLREKGFRLVTLHELIGRSRSDVMPVARSQELLARVTAQIRQASILALSWLNAYLPWLAILGSVLGVSRLVFVAVSVLRHRRLERERAALAWRPSSVAVIVPAYNEEKVICKTIASVLASTWTDFEIIVVDDGSTDGTAQAVRDAYGGDPRVKVFTKANGGKAAAANFALSRTEAEVVVCIDADTVLGSDAISLLIRHFADPAVGAVAGTAVVGNEVNLLTRFQAVEYAIGQYLDRRAFAMFNAIGVVPGAIGAWRRAALLGVGGYAHNTVAEDSDATFSVIRSGWTIRYEPGAEARTEAPENLRGFLKQRHRWMFGMLQVISKHAGALRQGPAGIAWITIPNVVIFQFGFSFLVPLLDIMAVFGLISACRDWMSVPDPGVPSGHFEYLKWWMLFQAMDIAAMVGMLRISRVRGSVKLVPLILLQRFLYWPLIYWTAATTLAAAMKGRAAGWNKLRRTGSVEVECRPAA